ncbi:hypothetical protein [Algoriphagus persicinus]|uniref:hypothetical protein n=1 Tax=Algoriphagus persicinus TaxID=3108754 RepID=UPI002B3B8966|nr:hypothetical protein [Algoriphagus sp. E1-3-M2]MEB2786154.1 hypothetical protein [Algoriphagus sp. E1-3-M2]
MFLKESRAISKNTTTNFFPQTGSSTDLNRFSENPKLNLMGCSDRFVFIVPIQAQMPSDEEPQVNINFPKSIQKSPNASGMGSYGNYDVNLYPNAYRTSQFPFTQLRRADHTYISRVR